MVVLLRTMQRQTYYCFCEKLLNNELESAKVTTCEIVADNERRHWLEVCQWRFILDSSGEFYTARCTELSVSFSALLRCFTLPLVKR